MLVVGAGPSGSWLSYLLSKGGFKVKHIDIKEKIGIPNHCSGLVDKRVVDMVGDDLEVDRPQKADVVTPKGSFQLRSERMYVLDRVVLDQKLAVMAEAEGSMLSKKTTLLNFTCNDHSVSATLKTSQGYENVEARYLIGADGPTSTVRRGIGIPPPRLLQSVQYDIAGRSDRVRIFLDRSRTPDFFSWEIPMNFELEVGASGVNSENQVRIMTEGERVLNRRGGLIPIGPTALGTGNCFLIGDAAGQSKATTGGGLYAALMSARALSSAMMEGEPVLPKYRQNWLSLFGREVNRAYSIRKLLDRFEKYYGIWVPLVKSSLKGINEMGDVDYPSKTFLYLLGVLPLRIPLALKEFVDGSPVK